VVRKGGGGPDGYIYEAVDTKSLVRVWEIIDETYCVEETLKRYDEI
jgi:hypothetical protein